MTSIALLNLALHSLLLSATGWVLFRWCLRDARQRACASLLVLIIATVGSCLIACWPSPNGDDAARHVTLPPSSWKPDWKVTLAPMSAAILPEAAASPVRSAPLPVPKLITMLWLAGLTLQGLRHSARSLAVWSWRRSLRPLLPAEIASLPQGADSHRLMAFNDSGSPCVVGLMKAVIAIPADAFGSLTSRQWFWLLRHEGCHISARDPLVAWVLGWIKALWWWNPFAHALIENWTQAREEVCDSIAVQPYEAAGYADFLLDVAGKSLPTAGVVSMAASKPARRLRSRLRALLDARRVRERVGVGFALLMTAYTVAGSMLVSCMGIAESQPAPAAAAAAATTVSPTKANSEQLTWVIKTPPDFLKRSSKKDSSVKTLLEDQGIAFPEGASATYISATSQLIVKNTETNLQRIVGYVDQVSQAPIQVHLKCRFLESDVPLGKHGEIMNDGALQIMMREAAQKKGTSLLSAPSLSTRLGQRATVEVGKQEPHPVSGREPRFIGVRVEVNSEPTKGPAILLTAKATMSREERIPVGASKDDIDWDKTRTITADKKALLLSNQTLILDLGEIVRGKFVTVFVTAEALTPESELAGSFDQKFPPLHGARVTDVSKKQGEAAKRHDMKEAERQAEIDAGSKIYISSKVVVYVVPKKDGDAEDDFKWLTGGIETVSDTTNSEFKKNPPASLARSPFSGQNAIAGVFTDPQFQGIIRAVFQRKDMTLTSLPNMTVASGTDATCKVEASDRPFDLKVEPVLGPDGYTIDLAITLPSNPQAAKSRMATTAVTVWDGQTVGLGSLLQEDENGRQYRMIFVTARKISPATPRKK